MKRAKQVRPRNPLATVPLLKKGGTHARKDKRASRARQKSQSRKLNDAAGSE